MKSGEIKTRPPFSEIFDINEDVLAAIKYDMESNGYDLSQPVVIWDGTLIDGHTRLIAARAAGIADIPVVEREFPSEDEAVDYAIHNQRDRRNLTPQERLHLVELVDKRKGHGGDRSKLPSGNLKSHDITARTLGISPRQVSRVRAVLDNPEARAAVERGDKSINQADREIRQTKKLTAPASTFNYTNENIDWAKWSWNPVTGCKHGCKYCYARDIATRFNPNGFKPTFYEDRLAAPKNTRPKNEPGGNLVFVCSMADLFGEWVPDEWIEKVLDRVRANPQWTFLFLTKNPKRYIDIEWPENSWVGATTDTQERVDCAVDAFAKLKHRPPVLFVSCEPLLGSLNFGPGVDLLDWMIIGAQSRGSNCPEFQPKWEWVESLLSQTESLRVYCKPNLQLMIRERPEV